jgi:hypothetical protein
MKRIFAKFNSKCAATGQTIKKGELISYDSRNRKAYKQGHEPKERDQAADMVQVNEEAYFDNFCQQNNI